MAAYVQATCNASNNGSSATQAATVVNAPSASNTLILSFGGLRSATPDSTSLASVADSKGNTWTVDKQGSGTTNSSAAIASTIQDVGALTTSDTITVTVNLGPDALAYIFAVHEISGIMRSSSRVDTTASNSNTSNSTARSAGTTPTTANNVEVVWAAFSPNGTETSFTATSGYTAPGTAYYTANGISIEFEYKITTTTGIYNPTGTGGVSTRHRGVTVVYKTVTNATSTLSASSSSSVASIVRLPTKILSKAAIAVPVKVSLPTHIFSKIAIAVPAIISSPTHIFALIGSGVATKVSSAAKILLSSGISSASLLRLPARTLATSSTSVAGIVKNSLKNLSASGIASSTKEIIVFKILFASGSSSSFKDADPKKNFSTSGESVVTLSRVSAIFLSTTISSIAFLIRSINKIFSSSGDAATLTIASPSSTLAAIGASEATLSSSKVILRNLSVEAISVATKLLSPLKVFSSSAVASVSIEAIKTTFLSLLAVSGNSVATVLRLPAKIFSIASLSVTSFITVATTSARGFFTAMFGTEGYYRSYITSIKPDEAEIESEGSSESTVI